MARVKRGVTVRARHNKVLKLAKGYRGRNSTNVRQARERVEHGLQYAYRDRRKKKSAFRSLWIQRINAGVREYGLTYSKFINGPIYLRNSFAVQKLAEKPRAIKNKYKT